MNTKHGESYQLTFWSEEHLAKPSPPPENGKDLLTKGETSPLPIANSPTISIRNGSSGKMSRGSFPVKTTPLDAFWESFADQVAPCHQLADENGETLVWHLGRNARLPGAFLMLNTLESPNAEGGSLLSLQEVLETGVVPKRYFLSAKACSGILRRAEKCGKTLPDALKMALLIVIGQQK